jgi:hypothetical protein
MELLDSYLFLVLNDNHLGIGHDKTKVYLLGKLKGIEVGE